MTTPATIAALAVLRALAGSARDAADWADSRALENAVRHRPVNCTGAK